MKWSSSPRCSVRCVLFYAWWFLARKTKKRDNLGRVLRGNFFFSSQACKRCCLLSVLLIRAWVVRTGVRGTCFPYLMRGLLNRPYGVFHRCVLLLPVVFCYVLFWFFFVSCLTGASAGHSSLPRPWPSLPELGSAGVPGRKHGRLEEGVRKRDRRLPHLLPPVLRLRRHGGCDGETRQIVACV